MTLQFSPPSPPHTPPTLEGATPCDNRLSHATPCDIATEARASWWCMLRACRQCCWPGCDHECHQKIAACVGDDGSARGQQLTSRSGNSVCVEAPVLFGAGREVQEDEWPQRHSNELGGGNSMKAVITGTPLQIDGEPAEIAQLVELLSSGAVMVEHVHHWRLELPDEDGVQQGKCWCGQEKAFAPWDGASRKTGAIAIVDKVEPRAGVNVVAVSQGPKERRCKTCGGAGHDVRKCPQRTAVA